MPFLAAIPAAIAGAAEAAAGIAGAVGSAVAEAATTAASAAGAAASAAGEAATAAAATAGEVAGSAAASAGEIAGSASAAVTEAASSVGETAASVGSNVLRVAGQAARSSATRIGKGADELKSTMKSLEKGGKKDVTDAGKADKQINEIRKDSASVKNDLTAEKQALGDRVGAAKQEKSELEDRNTQLRSMQKNGHLTKAEKSSIGDEIKKNEAQIKSDDKTVHAAKDTTKKLDDSVKKLDKSDQALEKQSKTLEKDYKLPKADDAPNAGQAQHDVPEAYSSRLNNSLNGVGTRDGSLADPNSDLLSTGANAAFSLPGFAHGGSQKPAQGADGPDGPSGSSDYGPYDSYSPNTSMATLG